MKTCLFLSLVLIGALTIGCVSLLSKATPLPMPTDLNAAPLPEDSTIGGLDGVFISRNSEAGYQGSSCYQMFRFYPDGLVLFAYRACVDKPPTQDDTPDIHGWFNRENPDMWRGDYSVNQNRLFLRITGYDPIHEITFLRYFRGSFCGEQMVLQEPAVRFYSGVASPLTQPVQEFLALSSVTSSIADQSLPPASKKGRNEECQFIGFRFISRPTTTTKNGQSRLEIQTNPNQTCILTYISPAGITLLTANEGTIHADNEGICRWLFDIGSEAGTGTLIVQIGDITQSLSIDIR